MTGHGRDHWPAWPASEFFEVVILPYKFCHVRTHYPAIVIKACGCLAKVEILRNILENLTVASLETYRPGLACPLYATTLV